MHWFRQQVRVAWSLGLVLYVAHWMLDFYLVPESIIAISATRLCSMLVCALGVLATFRDDFEQYGERETLLGMVAGALQMSAMALIIPPQLVSGYFPTLLLLIVWIFNFSGLRFVPSLGASVFVIFAYAGTLALLPIPVAEHINLLFFLLAACALSGTAGYMQERIRRRLFQRQQMLDSERRRNELAALHDSLTGLPNRAYFAGRLEHSLQSPRHGDDLLAVMFIDLNNFKPVNDEFGHRIGDVVLREIAQRLRAAMRRSDFVARIGGDEFLVLVDGITSRVDGLNVAQALLRTVQEAIVVEWEGAERSLKMGASVGICYATASEHSAERLIQQADQAMYRAKRCRYGASLCVHHPALPQEQWDCLRLGDTAHENAPSTVVQ